MNGRETTAVSPLPRARARHEPFPLPGKALRYTHASRCGPQWQTNQLKVTGAVEDATGQGEPIGGQTDPSV